jgi:hypothetical protein
MILRLGLIIYQLFKYFKRNLNLSQGCAPAGQPVEKSARFTVFQERWGTVAHPWC